MSLRVTLPATFAEQLVQQTRPLAGMWVCSGSTINAEIAAGSGLDWLLIDGEHAPLGLESVLQQLQTVAAYPITPVVRVPFNDQVVIKQFLDLGAQNLLVPMVNSAEEARVAVANCHYPPLGVRGVGSALARAARWNRVDQYLQRAGSHVSLTVQIETIDAVRNAAEIAAVEGVDAIFIGPSDLAASMGLLGQQEHPDVVAAVEETIDFAKQAGVKVGVNAFAPATAERYLERGVDFILVGADVALLARASEALAKRYCGDADAEGTPRASY